MTAYSRSARVLKLRWSATCAVARLRDSWCLSLAVSSFREPHPAPSTGNSTTSITRDRALLSIQILVLKLRVGSDMWSRDEVVQEDFARAGSLVRASKMAWNGVRHRSCLRCLLRYLLGY